MESSRSSTSLTVVSVNGKPFVSGLTWKTLEHFRTYMTEAREYGKAHGMDMVAIRRGGILQAGFAPKSEHRLRGMYSLASALAGQLGDNWIGVFPLPNERFAFVAVHDGSVMVGRDFVGDRYTVEMEFNDAFNLLQSDGTWSENGRIIAPPDWDLANEHSTLEDLLGPKQLRAEYRLRPLTFGLTRREIALTVGALVVVACAGVGFLKWQSVQDEKNSSLALAATLELQKAQAEQAAREAAELRKNIVRPWEQLPSVGSFLEACSLFWRDTPLSVGGWIFAGGKCGPGKALATFERPEHGTTVAEFANTVRESFGQQPTIFDGGTVGSIKADFHITADATDTLRPSASLLESFTAHLQAAGQGTTFAVHEKPWVAPADQPEAIPPDWITQAFTIETMQSPAALMAGLDTQGIRILELGVTLNQDDAQLDWKITGELYGR